MKRITTYTIILAALLCAACSNTEESYTPQGMGKELVVRTELVGASEWGSTRSENPTVYGTASESMDGEYLITACKQEWTGIADSIPVNDPETRGTPIGSAAGIANLRVNVFNTGSANWTTSYSRTTVIDATNVSGSFTTSPGYSWPMDAVAKTSLFAYSPLPNASNNGLTDVAPNKISYTVPSDVTKQPDLCVAVPNMNVINNDGTQQVRTFFLSHQLTAVGFTMLGWNLRITKITVSGVAMTGTLTMNPSSVHTWTTSGTGSRDVGVTGSSYQHTINNNYADITTSSGYLMMIPQTLSDAATVTITYASTNTAVSTGGTITAKLKDLGLTWQAGDKITYNIRLKTAPAVTTNELIIDNSKAGYTTSQPLSFLMDNKDNLTFTWEATWLKIHRGSPKVGDMSGGALSGWQTTTGGPWYNIYFFAANDNTSTTSDRTALVKVSGTRSGIRTFTVRQKSFFMVLSSTSIRVPAPINASVEMSYTISESSITPTVTNLPAWLSASVNASTKKITFIAKQPNYGGARSQQVTVKAASQEITVTVTQEATIPFKSTGATSLEWNEYGGVWGNRVTYDGVDAPTVSRSNSWITVTVTPPNAQGKGVVSLSASKHTGFSIRNMTVTLTLNGKSFNVACRQITWH